VDARRSDRNTIADDEPLRHIGTFGHAHRHAAAYRHARSPDEHTYPADERPDADEHTSAVEHPPLRALAGLQDADTNSRSRRLIPLPPGGSLSRRNFTQGSAGQPTASSYLKMWNVVPQGV
jgi:hypothetical protein